MTLDLTAVAAWMTEITSFLTDIGIAAPITVLAVVGLGGYAGRHVIRLVKKGS